MSKHILKIEGKYAGAQFLIDKLTGTAFVVELSEPLQPPPPAPSPQPEPRTKMADECEWDCEAGRRYYISAKGQSILYRYGDATGFVDIWLPSREIAHRALNALGETLDWRRVPPEGYATVWRDPSVSTHSSIHTVLNARDTHQRWKVFCSTSDGRTFACLKFRSQPYEMRAEAQAALDSYAEEHKWVVDHYVEIVEES